MSKKEKSITVRREKDGTIKTEFVNCNEFDHEMMDLLLEAADMYIKLQENDSKKKK